MHTNRAYMQVSLFTPYNIHYNILCRDKHNILAWLRHRFTSWVILTFNSHTSTPTWICPSSHPLWTAAVHVQCHIIYSQAGNTHHWPPHISFLSLTHTSTQNEHTHTHTPLVHTHTFILTQHTTHTCTRTRTRFLPEGHLCVEWIWGRWSSLLTEKTCLLT